MHVSKLKTYAACLLIALGLTAGSGASAEDDKYLVGTGVSGKTYWTMMSNVQSRCERSNISVIEQKQGSVGNIQQLNSKELDLGIVQSDVLELYRLDSPDMVSGIKVVAPLHIEEAHVLVRADLKVDTNFIGGGGRLPETLMDLNGVAVRIGGWGGSLKTADALNRYIMPKYSNGRWKGMVVPVEPPKKGNPQNQTRDETYVDVMKKNNLDVLILVLGKPDSSLAALPAGAVRLLKIDQEIAKKNPKFFVPATIDYTNLSGSTVTTLGVQALLVARNFESSEDIARITGLRNCIMQNLPTFRDRRGYHPKWSNVKPEMQIEQPMFPFVNDGATARTRKN